MNGRHHFYNHGKFLSRLDKPITQEDLP